MGLHGQSCNQCRFGVLYIQRNTPEQQPLRTFSIPTIHAATPLLDRPSPPFSLDQTAKILSTSTSIARSTVLSNYNHYSRMAISTNELKMGGRPKKDFSASFNTYRHISMYRNITRICVSSAFPFEIYFPDSTKGPSWMCQHVHRIATSFLPITFVVSGTYVLTRHCLFIRGAYISSPLPLTFR